MRGFHGHDFSDLSGQEKREAMERVANKARVDSGVSGLSRKMRRFKIEEGFLPARSRAPRPQRVRRDHVKPFVLSKVVKQFRRTGQLPPPEIKVAFLRTLETTGTDGRALKRMIQAMLLREGIEPNPGPETVDSLFPEEAPDCPNAGLAITVEVLKVKGRVSYICPKCRLKLSRVKRERAPGTKTFVCRALHPRKAEYPVYAHAGSQSEPSPLAPPTHAQPAAAPPPQAATPLRPPTTASHGITITDPDPPVAGKGKARVPEVMPPQRPDATTTRPSTPTLSPPAPTAPPVRASTPEGPAATIPTPCVASNDPPTPAPSVGTSASATADPDHHGAEIVLSTEVLIWALSVPIWIITTMWYGVFSFPSLFLILQTATLCMVCDRPAPSEGGPEPVVLRTGQVAVGLLSLPLWYAVKITFGTLHIFGFCVSCISMACRCLLVLVVTTLKQSPHVGPPAPPAGPGGDGPDGTPPPPDSDSDSEHNEDEFITDPHTRLDGHRLSQKDARLTMASTFDCLPLVVKQEFYEYEMSSELRLVAARGTNVTRQHLVIGKIRALHISLRWLPILALASFLTLLMANHFIGKMTQSEMLSPNQLLLDLRARWTVERNIGFDGPITLIVKYVQYFAETAYTGLVWAITLIPLTAYNTVAYVLSCIPLLFSSKDTERVLSPQFYQDIRNITWWITTVTFTAYILILRLLYYRRHKGEWFLPIYVRVSELIYTPHAVSCAVQEFSAGTNSTAVASSITGKMLRLSTLPIPDALALQLQRGSEEASKTVLEGKSGFTSELAHVAQTAQLRLTRI